MVCDERAEHIQGEATRPMMNRGCELREVTIMLYGIRGSMNIAKDSIRLWCRLISVGRQPENNANGKLEIDVAIRRSELVGFGWSTQIKPC